MRRRASDRAAISHQIPRLVHGGHRPAAQPGNEERTDAERAGPSPQDKRIVVLINAKPAILIQAFLVSALESRAFPRSDDSGKHSSHLVPEKKRLRDESLSFEWGFATCWIVLTTRSWWEWNRLGRRFCQNRRGDVLVTMQDGWNCSQETDNEPHARVSGSDAYVPINNEPTKVVSGGSVPRLHELDGLRSDLELAHRKIDALQEDRRDLERRIKRMALQMLTDELTGLRNRHRFREDLEAAWAYAARQNLLLSLIVLDLDDLQSYNDAFGESAGDQLLRHLAAYLTSGQRAYDMIARFDGGEFALLLPSSDRTDAGRRRASAKRHSGNGLAAEIDHRELRGRDAGIFIGFLCAVARAVRASLATGETRGKEPGHTLRRPSDRLADPNAGDQITPEA